MRILIVDDTAYSRHYHMRMLERHGHEVVTAESAEEALQFLQADQKIRVVLTDFKLGDRDGIQLFRAAQKLQYHDESGDDACPDFILMTSLRPEATPNKEDREKIESAKEIGFADVLFKPVNSDALKKALGLDFDKPLDMLNRLVTTIIGRADTDAGNKLLDRLDAEIGRLMAFTSDRMLTTQSE